MSTDVITEKKVKRPAAASPQDAVDWMVHRMTDVLTDAVGDAVADLHELAAEEEGTPEDLPYVLVTTGIDPDKLMLTGVHPDASPVFTISEMARFFFARSNHWVRWLEQKGKMVAADAEGNPRKVGQRRTESGARVYTLGDVEEVAHALAQQRVISGLQLQHTLTIVLAQAQMYELL